MYSRFLKHTGIDLDSLTVTQRGRVGLAFGAGILQAMVAIRALNEIEGEEITKEFIKGLYDQSKSFVDQIVKEL